MFSAPTFVGNSCKEGTSTLFSSKLFWTIWEEQAVITKKASGKQKLKDLGLDDAEIKALIG